MSSAAASTDAFFDLVGHMRDHLDGLSQVVAAAFFCDHGRIDETGGGIRIAMQVLVYEPLVVTEVEVGLTSIFCDEDLAVLEGVHRARIHVDVRVQLDHCDA